MNDLRGNTKFDALVVGAGPAGLSAAALFAARGFSTLLVESGGDLPDRGRYEAAEVTTGVGGAGLYSDGKFSFFPSATELWTLADGDALTKSYEWTRDLLRTFGMDAPDQVDGAASGVGADQQPEAWQLKSYPSHYLSLARRFELVEALRSESHNGVCTRTSVDSIRYNEEEDTFQVHLSGAPDRTVAARRIVYAAGRFGPTALERWGVSTGYFRRLEVGFRIQQPAHQAFFDHFDETDPKLLLRRSDGAVEWRTFCACRQGEAVMSNTNGWWTVSGRSDCPPTGVSNIGFNTRILDPSAADRVWGAVSRGMSSHEARYEVRLDDVLEHRGSALAALDRTVGGEARDYMLDGLRRLADHFPGRLTSAVLIGPTLEGIGWYPDLDDDLRHLKLPLWVAGDAAGRFRGIVAAMVSGRYAALKAVESLLV